MGDWGNEILFQVRKHLPPVRLKSYSESADGVLIEQKVFSPWIAANFKEESIRQALFYAWILDQLPRSEKQKAFGRSIDLGSKNFVYSPALCRLLSQRFESFELTGIEVDPYRTYIDFYKRGDYARYYATRCGEAYPQGAVAYLPGNWLTWDPPAQYDLIFCFFPFLFADLNKGWGLTPRHFSPKRFYEKSIHQAREVILFHQGSEERDQSLKLIQSIGVGRIAFQQQFFENPWLKRKHPVEVIQWVNEESVNSLR